MRALLDVNVLLALFDQQHSLHGRASEWWESRSDTAWATCPLTENGFLRIVSGAGYHQRHRLSDAREALRGQLAREDHGFWPDDISIADETIFNRRYLHGPNQITDVYLLALATRNGGRLVTFDRSIPLAAARHARPDNLVVL